MYREDNERYHRHGPSTDAYDVEQRQMRQASMTRNVDRLIAEENRAFLADPAAVADAQAEGDLYRQRGEAEGWLPVEDRIMRPSPGFRYDDSDIPQDERDLGQWDLDHND